MLLVVQETVAAHFTNGVATAQDHASLHYLLLGVADGHHRLTGTRATLSALSRIESLGPLEKRAVEMAFSRVAEEGQILYRLSVIAKITISGHLAPVHSLTGTQQVLEIPLRWFDSTAKVQPTTLLGENLSDTGIAKIIGEVGTHLAGLFHLPIVCSESHGGGGTIGVVLAHHIRHEKICICLVDSDKHSPNDEVGTTARQVEPYRDKTLYPIIEVLQTNSCELENVLPDLFYIVRFGTNPQYSMLAQLMKSATEANAQDIRQHIDTEKGVKLFDTFASTAGPAANDQFWLGKVPQLKALSGQDALHLQCENATNCAANNRVQCTCILITGISANILQEFLVFEAERSRYTIGSELDVSVKNEWQQLGLPIGSWCCGADRIRA